jgi:hypothetical protein
MLALVLGLGRYFFKRVYNGQCRLLVAKNFGIASCCHMHYGPHMEMFKDLVHFGNVLCALSQRPQMIYMSYLVVLNLF